MATILQTTFPKAFSSMKKFEFDSEVSLNFVPKGPIDNKSAIVQIMA